MDEFPTNERRPSPEKITDEGLVAFAKEKPLRDPEVEKMLVQWLEDTRISEVERVNVFSVDLVMVAIKQSAMKYRLGFLSREEVLGELEQAGGCLASEYVDTKESCAELSQLMNDIEDDVYDVVKKEG